MAMERVSTEEGVLGGDRGLKEGGVGSGAQGWGAESLFCGTGQEEDGSKNGDKYK